MNIACVLPLSAATVRTRLSFSNKSFSLPENENLFLFNLNLENVHVFAFLLKVANLNKPKCFNRFSEYLKLIELSQL
jgi:hypothetical protein